MTASPAPDVVKSARLHLHMNLATAAGVVYATRASWHRWETVGGIPPGTWELFLIKMAVPLRAAGFIGE